MPPWTGLCKLGKSAMDGLFSPDATWMLRWEGLAVGAALTACPKGDGIHPCIPPFG